MSPPPSRGRARLLAEVGVAVALAYVLGWLGPWRLPQGGQLSLEMLPVLAMARLRGVLPGVSAGAMFGFLKIIQEPVLLQAGQVLLDYPMAFGALGLAGAFPRGRGWDMVGVLAGAGARFAFHTLSGVIFIALFLPEGELPAHPLVYSALYNASYIIPSTLLCLVAVPPLVSRLGGA